MLFSYQLNLKFLRDTELLNITIQLTKDNYFVDTTKAIIIQILFYEFSNNNFIEITQVFLFSIINNF